MQGGFCKLALIAFIIGFGGFVEAAKLEGFSSPLSKKTLNKASPQASTVQNQANKQIKLKAQLASTNKNTEIKDAVIWHAPARKFLTSKFTDDEIKNLDTQALEILINGLNTNNQNFAEANKKSFRKNPLILKIADIAEASSNQSVSSITNSLLGNRAEAESYVRKILAQVYHEYSIYKNLFKPNLDRDSRLHELGTNAKKNLIYLCGIQSIEEVETLWRRT